MINWTEEDIKFLCENVMAPLGHELANMMEEHDKISSKSLEKVFDALIGQIKEIRYEQERDRRFYRAVFTQVFGKSEVAYDEFYKDWCEEFDKLNKEKFI